MGGRHVLWLTIYTSLSGQSIYTLNELIEGSFCLATSDARFTSLPSKVTNDQRRLNTVNSPEPLMWENRIMHGIRDGTCISFSVFQSNKRINLVCLLIVWPKQPSNHYGLKWSTCFSRKTFQISGNTYVGYTYLSMSLYQLHVGCSAVKVSHRWRITWYGITYAHLHDLLWITDNSYWLYHGPLAR